MSRARYYGGSCNLWAGRSMRLSPDDMAPEGDPERSGWPLTHGELSEWYPAAARRAGAPRPPFLRAGHPRRASEPGRAGPLRHRPGDADRLALGQGAHALRRRPAHHAAPLGPDPAPPARQRSPSPPGRRQPFGRRARGGGASGTHLRDPGSPVRGGVRRSGERPPPAALEPGQRARPGGALFHGPSACRLRPRAARPRCATPLPPAAVPWPMGSCSSGSASRPGSAGPKGCSTTTPRWNPSSPDTRRRAISRWSRRRRSCCGRATPGAAGRWGAHG